MPAENTREGKKTKPRAKNTRAIIEPYVRRGIPNTEIAEKTGIKYVTVWAAAKKIREQLAETKGKTAICVRPANTGQLLTIQTVPGLNANTL